MEHDLFSVSKLPVSYKAAVMKRVNEIKKLTGRHELHMSIAVGSNSECANSTVDYTAVNKTSILSVENTSSFTDPSPGSADLNTLHNTTCDKDDTVSPSSACRSKASTESDDSCDILKSNDLLSVSDGAESSSVSDRNGNDANDVCWKDESSTTPRHIIHSRNAGRSSWVAVTSRAGKVSTTKSVRISDSPPTVSYIDCPALTYSEVCNGASDSTVKVGQLLQLNYQKLSFKNMKEPYGQTSVFMCMRK